MVSVQDSGEELRQAGRRDPRLQDHPLHAYVHDRFPGFDRAPLRILRVSAWRLAHLYAGSFQPQDSTQDQCGVGRLFHQYRGEWPAAAGQLCAATGREPYVRLQPAAAVAAE